MSLFYIREKILGEISSRMQNKLTMMADLISHPCFLCTDHIRGCTIQNTKGWGGVVPNPQMSLPFWWENFADVK